MMACELMISLPVCFAVLVLMRRWLMNLQNTEKRIETYAMLVGKNFFSARTYNFTINSNGITFSTEAIL
jgi:hypothetical protein